MLVGAKTNCSGPACRWCHSCPWSQSQPFRRLSRRGSPCTPSCGDWVSPGSGRWANHTSGKAGARPVPRFHVLPLPSAIPTSASVGMPSRRARDWRVMIILVRTQNHKEPSATLNFGRFLQDSACSSSSSSSSSSSPSSSCSAAFSARFCHSPRTLRPRGQPHRTAPHRTPWQTRKRSRPRRPRVLCTSHTATTST